MRVWSYTEYITGQFWQSSSYPPDNHHWTDVSWRQSGTSNAAMQPDTSSQSLNNHSSVSFTYHSLYDTIHLSEKITEMMKYKTLINVIYIFVDSQFPWLKQTFNTYDIHFFHTQPLICRSVFTHKKLSMLHHYGLCHSPLQYNHQVRADVYPELTLSSVPRPVSFLAHCTQLDTVSTDT